MPPKIEALRWPITAEMAKRLRDAMMDQRRSAMDVARACGLEQDVQIRRMLRIGKVRAIKSSEYLPVVCAYLGLEKMDFMPLDETQLRLLKALQRLRQTGVDDRALVEEFEERVETKVSKAVAARGDVQVPRHAPTPTHIKSRGSSN
jgi:hypothetical protein